MLLFSRGGLVFGDVYNESDATVMDQCWLSVRTIWCWIN